MSDQTYRITWLCSRCGGWHRKHGPLGFCMRGCAEVLDMGAKAVTVEETTWAQCNDIDVCDWLASKGVQVTENVAQWGGFSHPSGGSS